MQLLAMSTQRDLELMRHDIAQLACDQIRQEDLESARVHFASAMRRLAQAQSARFKSCTFSGHPALWDWG